VTRAEVRKETPNDATIMMLTPQQKWERAGRPQEIPSNADSDPYDAMLTIGWVCSFLMPLIGFIFGIILAAKNRPQHGAGMMVASIVAALIWVAILSAIIS
jgi:hypothetical protein